MKNSNYCYPAIFNYANNRISISFPDLTGCLSSAKTIDEAFYNAEEVLGLYMWNLEDDNEPIPEPTPIEKIQCESNQRIIPIKIWMPLVRNEMETATVKKTLTIPAWLNRIAEARKVNYSHILQAALKDYLDVKEKI